INKGFETDAIQNFFADTKQDNCLVITTGAHKGFDNPQAKWAHEKGIIVLSQGQALSLFMDGEIIGHDGQKAIAVAGSHGKTTISSLLATTLKAMGLEPS